MATVCWICWRENLGRKTTYVLVDLGRQGAGDAALVGRLFQHIFSVASHTLNHDPRVGQIMIQYGSKTFGMKTGYVESPWEDSTTLFGMMTGSQGCNMFAKSFWNTQRCTLTNRCETFIPKTLHPKSLNKVSEPFFLPKFWSPSPQ